MNIQKIDLNLFRVFEAVMKHRSVSVAASELHLSPSAVSHALGRLRSVLDDALFVSGPAGMEPTARANELAPHVRAGLERIDGALSSAPFEPAQAQRTFRIATSDYGASTIMPPLVARLAASAPQIDLRVFPFNRTDTVRQLDEGRVDIAISWFSELPERMRRRQVWYDEEAIIARRGHPLEGGEITRARLLDYPHVVVELTGNGEAPDGSAFMTERGVSRRVWVDRLLLDLRSSGETLIGRAAVSVPHYASAIAIVESSDMLATMPRSMALAAARRGAVVLLDLPYEPMTATVDAIWHERHDSDPGLQWLVAQMGETSGADAANG